MEANHFRIAGGEPMTEVSWQVTDIRHDPYAQAHRIEVERDKGEQRGYFLHPELFGQQPERAIFARPGASLHDKDAVEETFGTPTATAAFAPTIEAPFAP